MTRCLLVDCGPDMREQLLREDIGRVDGVIVTHEHADHCHGIDDLRRLSQILGGPVPLYARADVLEKLAGRFGYIFRGTIFYAAVADPVELGDELPFGDAPAPVRRSAARRNHVARVCGSRREDGPAVYAIDFHDLTEDMRSLYAAADVWISDCLGRFPHPTHTHLDAVLDWAREMRVGKLYLSHMNNSMDYRTLVEELPEWAAPAHDGLEIELR